VKLQLYDPVHLKYVVSMKTAILESTILRHKRVRRMQPDACTKQIYRAYIFVAVKRQRKRPLAIFGHEWEHITKINTIRLGCDV
jgi:hypothetical protein